MAENLGLESSDEGHQIELVDTIQGALESTHIVELTRASKSATSAAHYRSITSLSASTIPSLFEVNGKQQR